MGLNKLLNMELVKRIKEMGNMARRPKYLYSVTNFDELKGKVVKEIEDYTNIIRNLITI